MTAIFDSWRFQSLIEHLGRSLDLQRRGTKGGTLGDHIANLIVYGILGQHARELAPDGTRLAPLSPKYKLWKTLQGLSPNILHKHELMMQFGQLRGMLVISSDAMSLWYGIDPRAIAEASYTQEGQLNSRGTLHSPKSSNPRIPRSGWVRPAREFFDINETSSKWIDEYMSLEIDDWISRF